jgi:Tol biopolymer transport system component
MPSPESPAAIARHRPSKWLLLPLLAVASAVFVAGDAIGHAATASSASATGRRTNGLIAFVRQRSATALGGALFVMHSTGGDQLRLTRGQHDLDPAWSPDGRKLAFIRGSDVYLMNGDGTGLRRLTRLGANAALSPTWSPDGREIAFVRILHTDLWVMDASGRRQRLLAKAAPGSRGFDFFGPRWSPDGRRILFFATVAGGISQIFVIHANGSGRTALTQGRLSHESPDWSPDGREIVFVGPPLRVAGGGRLYVMKANGSDQRPLRIDGDDPIWSPDGRKILFGRFDDYFEDIYAMDADGTHVRRLTRGHFDFGRAWQPVVRRR